MLDRNKLTILISVFLILLIIGVFLLYIRISNSDKNDNSADTQNTLLETQYGNKADNPQVKDCLIRAPENPYLDDAQDAELIYSECKEATKLFPDNAEIAYLAATSALETNRTVEALAGFKRAEQLGSCNALYFLGDYERYFEEDLEAAENYYRQGAECGDKRAAQEIVSSEVFEKSAQPELFKAIADSDVETLNRVRFVNASYVFGFYKELGEQYLGKEFDPCWKANLFRGGEILNKLSAAEKGDAVTFIDGYAYENLLPVAFQVIYPDQGSKALEERRESLREAGKADLLRIVETSNCKSLIAEKLVEGVEKFAQSKKTLFQTMKELKPQIKSIQDLPEVLRNGGNYC